ncbi:MULTISPECIES: hypothetical protein [Pseudomonas]|uniref:hypothetical protein n=1 Tax=Pseudomonas TaxID=286 RepID=UPI001F002F6E|nr:MULTISPECIES: hypothetical protein [Pseudomonas]MCG8293624.1 hypothetical protein [Pseudomonas entomophila]
MQQRLCAGVLLRRPRIAEEGPGSKHFVLSPLNLFGLGTLYLGKAQTSKTY